MIMDYSTGIVSSVPPTAIEDFQALAAQKTQTVFRHWANRARAPAEEGESQQRTAEFGQTLSEDNV